jgi:hypothetical protein
MNEIRIGTKDDQTAFRPGERIEGALGWNLPEQLQSMEVRLAFRLTRDEPTFREDLWNAPLAGFGTRDVVLLDGAEQLNRWEWKKFQRFTRLTGGLLITTHRAGRLPTLYECRTTPQLLASLVTELVRVPEWPVSQSPAELYWQHRGNLREAFRDLYDAFAESSEMDAFDRVANIRAGLGVAKRLGVR